MDADALTALIETLGVRISQALQPLAVLEERDRERARAAPVVPPPPPPPPAAPIKSDLRVPTFDGTGEVEGFITQFEGVAALAPWTPDVLLLQLQAALTGGAHDLGHGPTVEAILASLRLRYGITPREARGKLEALRKDPQTTLQEHSTLVGKLARLAYAGLPEVHQLEMAKERFLSSLGNLGLQKHLLGVPTPTMEAAVRAGNEYLQLTATHPGARTSMGRTYQVADGTSDEEVVSPDDKISSVRDDRMDAMQQLLADLIRQVERLGQAQKPAPARPARTVPKCWNCQEAGHFQRDCTKQRRQPAPNGQGPR